MTERGPEEPTLVAGIEQYRQKFGGYLRDSYMTYAVEGFFENGGKRCLIGRIVKGTGDGSVVQEANLVLLPPDDNIKINAIGKGNWGQRIAIRVDNASLDPSPDASTPTTDIDIFKLTVIYWREGVIDPDTDFITPQDANFESAKNNLLRREGLVVEVFDNLSIKEFSPDFFVKKVSDISNLIDIELRDKSQPLKRPNNTTDSLFLPLAPGDEEPETPSRDDFLGDSRASPSERRGLAAFKEIDEISILYVSDLYKLPNDNQMLTLIDDLRIQCENLKDRFAIVDAPPNWTDISGLWPPNQAVSKYVAYYYPWIKICDPLTKSLKLIPPGGHIAGIYAKTDSERGVHKAPANVKISGALDLEFIITKGEQDILNPRGVNCIRRFRGRGIRVWGARTTIQDPLWKYINIRRLFLYLEESIEEGTQWVVFEPNDRKLWARVKQIITQFLIRVWKEGALVGTTPEEAFFVKCDRTTMTQEDIDNGRLIVLVGVAPVKPAEFVIFRIAQWQGGSEISE